MALTAKEHGATYSVVRARKQHRCYDRTAAYCPRVIQPGLRYVRSVMFPNHDIYSYVDRYGKPLRQPVVHDLCFDCASQYHTTGLLVIASDREERARESV